MQSNIKHIDYAYPNKLAEYENQSTYLTILKCIRKYLPSSSRVLDVGCGRGELMEYLSNAGYEVAGCDADKECVRMGSRFGLVIHSKVEDLSIDSFTIPFDCIILSHSLEHFPEPKNVLKHLISFKPKIIVTSVPNPFWIPVILKAFLKKDIDYANTGHLYSWDWNHWKTFIEIGCSLEILEWAYDCVTLPLPRKTRSLFLNMGLLPRLEQGIFRHIFPRFCRSITTVIRV